MLTGEMIHTAYCAVVRRHQERVHEQGTDLDTLRAERSWEEISEAGQAMYGAMADALNAQLVAGGIAPHA